MPKRKEQSMEFSPNRKLVSDGFPAHVTPRELADITGGSEACIRRMRERGDLPAYKQGKRWYINRVRLMGAAL